MAHPSEARPVLGGPARMALAWAATIIVGAVLLWMPFSAQHQRLSFLDALFTATSAVCVTGLSTITISEDLSPVGQGIVLVLIQAGGLGIGVLATLLLLAAGRATLSSQQHTQGALAAVRVKPLALVRWAVGVTLLLEITGAIILSLRFGGGADGWWKGVFHSISAFCNAGFSLYPDGLTRYVGDPVVNFTITGLIIAGGLGFIALRQLSLWLTGQAKGERFPLFLHTRVVLAGSIALWALGMLMFLVLEWDNTMYGMPVGTRLLAAWFQSVTTRTAGYNTLDFGAMREPTLFFTMFFMQIGGAPGGCAGGVKITTVVVVLAAVRAHYRGAYSTGLFKRSVPPEVVNRAFQLIALTLLFMTLVVSGLLLTEEFLGPLEGRTSRLTELAFEAVSACGTVGLSTGITPRLSDSGKLLIILCMYVGRLGPLALALAVYQPSSKVRFEYPKEELAIG